MFEPNGSLNIECELTAEANGVATTLIGSGSRLTWDMVDASQVFRGQPRSSRSEVAQVADALRTMGVTVDVVEGKHPLLTLGGEPSLLGRALFRSNSVRVRSVWRLVVLSVRRMR
jgi:hypothetical protein